MIIRDILEFIGRYVKSPAYKYLHVYASNMLIRNVYEYFWPDHANDKNFACLRALILSLNSPALTSLAFYLKQSHMFEVY